MSETTRPLSGNHALLCGMVAGALLCVEREDFKVTAEVDGDDFTGRTLITRPSGVWAVEVVPVKVQEDL
jgi:hypothetical protein